MDESQYRSYNFARSAAILALEASWPKLREKMDSLIKQIEISSIDYNQILNLKNTIEKFERKCIIGVISSTTPAKSDVNETFEPEKFDEIVVLLPKIYADFFEVFLGRVTFNFNRRTSGHLKHLANSIKFRAYNLDLRDKKKKDDEAGKSHTPDYNNCDLENGHTLGRDFTERGSLYQGYWQVEYMITELRNHTEHWPKGDSKKFLQKKLGRSIEDPVSGIASPGNFFILISILFLISYHFIDVMQTWIDTEILLK